MLYFCLYSNILFTCCFDFKGKVGGVGQLRQGAPQHVVAMVSSPCTSLEQWQAGRSLSPGVPRAGTLVSGPKAAWAAAGNSWALPCSSYLWSSPWRKPRSGHPGEEHRHSGTRCTAVCTPSPHSPERLCLHPPADRSRVPPSTSSSGSVMRKRRGLYTLRALSTLLQAGQAPTGKAALLCVAYIGFPSGASSFPLVGIKKKSEVPG